MNNTTKLLTFHGLCHLMLIPAFMMGELWMFVASFFWWQWIAATSISAGYHRYFSHKSFKTGDWYRWYVQAMALFSNPGPVLTWASTHRMHHAHSDTEQDPHSPKYKGFWRVYMNTWGNQVTIKRKYLKDLLKDNSVSFFYKHYFKLLTALAVILFVIDPLLLVFGLGVPVVFAFHGYALINAWTHRSGQPVNSWLANIFTAGEGWHENHHKESYNWRIGWQWWQLDTAAWFIRLIKY